MTRTTPSGSLIFSNGHVRVYAAPLAPGSPTAPVVAALLGGDPAVPVGFEVRHTPQGAPYIEDMEADAAEVPHISVTHSRTAVAVAIAPAGCPVGIDAETVGRDRQLMHVSRRFLSPSEMPRWGAGADMLLRAWTLKEALYKAALITGLPLGDIPLPAAGEGAVVLRGRRFAIVELPSPYADNVISLAYLADFSFND